MSKIWFRNFTLEIVTSMGKDRMLDDVGVEFTDIGDDYIHGRMCTNIPCIDAAMHG